MSTVAHKNVAKALGKVGDLPSMPEVVAEVLRLTEDPDVAMGDVSHAIELDPGLSAKLLKVSNSPFYGMKQVVATLKLALVILGVREVRNIVLGISVVDGLRNRDTEALLAKSDFWHHSVMVAGLSKKLGNHFDLGLQGEDFISGLLHDIGKMVMWRQMRKEYEPLILASGGASLALCEAERAKFGFDHADAAALLAERWNLPGSLGDALWCHHPYNDRYVRDAKDPQLAALVRIANLAARDPWEDEEDGEIMSVADNEAWGVLLDGREPLEREERHAVLIGYWQELQETPALVL